VRLRVLYSQCSLQGHQPLRVDEGSGQADDAELEEYQPSDDDQRDNSSKDQMKA